MSAGGAGWYRKLHMTEHVIGQNIEENKALLEREALHGGALRL